MEIKQGRSVTRVIMLLLLLAVLAYVGINVYEGLVNPLKTSLALVYTVDESCPVTGYVIRDEELVYSNNSITSVIRGEGEMVGVGQTIALAFSDEGAEDTGTQIEELTSRIEMLQNAQEGISSIADVSTLENEIFDSVLTYKKDVADGEATSTVGTSLKSLVLRRDFLLSDDGSLSGEIETLQSQLDSLEASYSGSEPINADHSGMYSSMVDGYEEVLSSEDLDTLTLAGLDAVSRSTVDSSVIGKIITGFTWYFAAAVPSEKTNAYNVGDAVTLRFSEAGDISMTVNSIGEDTDGKRLVLFSCNNFLQETTGLRHETADIIYESYNGLRIPKEAIRFNDSGEAGVYIVVGETAEFRSINIIYETDDYYIVAQDKSSTENLWAGNEVIVAARNVYEGKIVR